MLLAYVRTVMNQTLLILNTLLLFFLWDSLKLLFSLKRIIFYFWFQFICSFCINLYYMQSHKSISCKIRSSECIEPNEQHCFIKQEFHSTVVFRDDFANFISHNNDVLMLVPLLPVNGIIHPCHSERYLLIQKYYE